MSDIFTTAFKLHTLGFTVIPSGGGDNGKAPIVDWKTYQDRQPTDKELNDWQDRFNPILWGIVTGEKSGVSVVDVETQELREKYADVLGPPHVITPRGGGHWYFMHPGHYVKTVAGILTGVDIRGDGGFVNIAGKSVYGIYNIQTMPAGDNLIPWEKLPLDIKTALSTNGSKPKADNKESQPIPEGQRNATLTSMAGALRYKGIEPGALEAALLAINSNQCQPPLPEAEVKAISASVSRYPTGISTNIYKYNASGQETTEAKRDKNGTDKGTSSLNKESAEMSRFESLAGRILAWVKDTSGWWETRELDNDLYIVNANQKENRKKILQRLREQGTIEAHPKINKQWRYIDTRVTSLSFKTATTAGVLPIRWPLNIEKHVNIFPGNMAVIAGSPNAGKTAFLLNFIYLNQTNLPIFYFCSEMGSVELRDRLDKFPGMDINDWKFDAIERAGDFADVMRPDCVNVIDYLEMTDELYRVNMHLAAISHKIGDGLAIVALQKKVDAKFGRGQEFGLEKPKLYLSLDRGKLQIIKGKSWAKKAVDPNGLYVTFKIVNGCQFEQTSEWDWKK